MKDEIHAKSALTWEVKRNEWGETRLLEEPLSAELAENEVLLRIDRFALTANNISYAASGDTLGYWKFFPAENDWGRIPVMGFGDVIASKHNDVTVGERLWGFYPMGTHLVIKAGNVDSGGFSDISSHREGLAPVYARFDRQPTAADPHREDLSMLLRGLFMTSWLVEDFMFDNEHFGANQYLITSASSKTSIALAFAVKQRGSHTTIGITSASNCDFVESLGCYDHVLSYDNIQTLDPETNSIVVDMAGSKTVLRTLHQHFGERLRYSCLVGATHHEDAGASKEQLPGAKPKFFFAPSQIEKRSKEWGRPELFKRIGSSLAAFQDFADQLLTVIRKNGAAAVEEIYQEVLSGNAPPEKGFVVSLWDS